MYQPPQTLIHTSFDAYLFDLDGTLLNTTPDIACAVNIMRTSEGLPALSLQEVERGVGRGATALILATTPSHLHSRVQELRQIFVRAYRENLCVNTRPYEGVVSCLNTLLNSGKRLALITNKPGHLAVPLLDMLGWSELFEVKLYGDSLSESKPSPLPIIHATRALGVHLDHCVFIGDTEVDAQAAQAAAVHFWSVSWGRAAEGVVRGQWGDQAQILERYAFV